MKESTAYHAVCETCKTTWWHSYRDSPGERFFLRDTRDVLMLSSSTAFEWDYLREVSVDVELGRNFTELSERYCRLWDKSSNSTRSSLYKTRLQEGYFVFKLLMYMNEEPGIAINKDQMSKRLDIEGACKKVMGDMQYRSCMSNCRS